MRVFGAWRAAAVVLREAVSGGCLPCAEVQFLLGFAWLLDAGFELAVEVPLGDFAAHGAEEGEVGGVGLG